MLVDLLMVIYMYALRKAFTVMYCGYISQVEGSYHTVQLKAGFRPITI